MKPSPDPCPIGWGILGALWGTCAVVGIAAAVIVDRIIHWRKPS